MILRRFIRRKVPSRGFFTGPIARVYEGTGKSTATILNKEPSAGLLVDSYSRAGFRLNNGVFVVGPMAIFPRTVLCWNVKNDYDISEDSLTLFRLLEPELDLLVIGFGSPIEARPSLDAVMLGMRKKCKTNIEVLPTFQAVSAYNYMVADGRNVAGAFIPPTYVRSPEDEILLGLRERRELYED